MSSIQTPVATDGRPREDRPTDDPGARGPRLLVLIDRYRPILGGAQNNIHELGRRLTERGFRVTVLTRRLYPETAGEETIEGVHVLRYGHARNRIVSKLTAAVHFAAHMVARRHDYDVVMCVPCSKLNDLLPMLVAYPLARIPYVIRATGMVDIFDRMFAWHLGSTGEALSTLATPPFVWRRIYDRAATIVVQSRALQARAEHFQLDSILIPNGADPERFHTATADERDALREALGLPRDRVVVIASGRFSRPKNQMTLIRAAEKLDRERGGGRFLLLVLGATERGQITSNEEELRAYVRDRGLAELVRLMTDIRNVEDYLRASDVYAMPSYSDEGMSNALVEAMASGLPVVSSNIPQNVAVLPEEGARFFDPMDIDTLAAHLDAVIGSETLRARMGAANAAHVAAHYDNRRLAERYDELLSRIARTGRAHA